MKIDQSKTAIIETAERLFARHGLEGVSLRHIAQQAGCRNNTAIQYHFGDKQGLVRAIFEYRLPALDRRRARMLEEADHQGLSEHPHTAVDILLRPIAELVDENGKHHYAAFLFSLQQADRTGRMRRDAMDLAPVTHRIAASLRDRLNQVDDRTLEVRTRAILAGFYSSLIYLDEEFDNRPLTRKEMDALIADAIEGAATALCKPPTPESR